MEKKQKIFVEMPEIASFAGPPTPPEGKGGKKKTLEVLQESEAVFFFWTSIKVSTGFGVSPAREKKKSKLQVKSIPRHPVALSLSLPPR